MSKIFVNPEILADRLFGNSVRPISVNGVSFDPVRCLVILDITGPDVPDAHEVQALFRVQTNPDGTRTETCTIVPVSQFPAGNEG